MKTVRAFVPALLIAASAPVFAYQAGDIIVRGGVAYVDPKGDSGSIVSPLNAINGIPDPVTVESSSGVTITGTYMFHKNFGVELVGALPFKHDINASGALAAALADAGLGNKVGSTQHLPPTLLLQFYPLDSSSFVQPYVGLGINYTKFFKDDTNDTLATGVGALTGNDVIETGLTLKSSTGVGAEIGADWTLNKQLSLNTSVWYLDIDTKAQIDATLAGGSVVKNAAQFDVTIDPYVYAVGLAYKF